MVGVAFQNMTNHMQTLVYDFVTKYTLQTDVQSRVLDLTSEVGELCKEVLKATNYGKSELPHGAISADWAEELGDVLFSLICLANSTNIDLDTCLQETLSKYQKRVESNNNVGSGR